MQFILELDRQTKRSTKLENTPGIIKYPFFSMTAEDKDNLYVCINTSDMRVPDLIRDRAVCIKGDIGEVLDRI